MVLNTLSGGCCSTLAARQAARKRLRKRGFLERSLASFKLGFLDSGARLLKNSSVKESCRAGLPYVPEKLVSAPLEILMKMRVDTLWHGGLKTTWQEGGMGGKEAGACLRAFSLHEVELSKNFKASLVKGEVVSPDGSEICTWTGVLSNS